MRAPTTLRKKKQLHHCTAVPVGARIARPRFVQNLLFAQLLLYKNLREGARRVIGATAKPLYPIDGKAGGLDRRSPRPPSSREGDRPQAVEGVRTRCFYAEYLFSSDTHRTHEAYEAYEV